MAAAPSPVGLKLVSLPRPVDIASRGKARRVNSGPTEKKTRSNRDNGPPRPADKSHCVNVSFVVFPKSLRDKIVSISLFLHRTFPVAQGEIQFSNVQTMTKRRFTLPVARLTLNDTPSDYLENNLSNGAAVPGTQRSRFSDVTGEKSRRNSIKGLPAPTADK